MYSGRVTVVVRGLICALAIVGVRSIAQAAVVDGETTVFLPAAMSGRDDDAELEERVAALEELFEGVKRSGDTLILTGANLQIVSGQGSTDAEPNGLGNLIVGYDEARTDGAGVKSGSHMLVLGSENSYSSFGGIVGGRANVVSADYASVIGGVENRGSGVFGVVLGGRSGEASGTLAVVGGGQGALASGEAASVCGGLLNRATGQFSVVGGGSTNVVSGPTSTIVGGAGNRVTAEGASVLGGQANLATGDFSVIDGGMGNRTDGPSSVVGGGRDRTATGEFNWVAGELREEK